MSEKSLNRKQQQQQQQQKQAKNVKVTMFHAAKQ